MEKKIYTRTKMEGFFNYFDYFFNDSYTLKIGFSVNFTLSMNFGEFLLTDFSCLHKQKHIISKDNKAFRFPLLHTPPGVKFNFDTKSHPFNCLIQRTAFTHSTIDFVPFYENYIIYLLKS